MPQVHHPQRSGNSDGLLKRFFNQLLALSFKIADRPEIRLLISGKIHVDHVLMSQPCYLSRRPYSIN